MPWREFLAKTQKQIYMTYNFCTLFDKNYLYKGLALYHSMTKHCPNYMLWILCMDETTYTLLNKLKLKNTVLIELKTLEKTNPKLLDVKNDRNAGEYSWTCKPDLLIYILGSNPELESITYLDSDLFFFTNPESAFKEFANHSIMLTPHRFPLDKKNWDKKSGRYNAGAIFFKNNKTTHYCLKWWREECIKWCYHRHEPGRLGDQKYLDQFNKRFSGVHDTILPSLNLGPWSLPQFDIKKSNTNILINTSPLILFHFHGLKIYNGKKITFDYGKHGLSDTSKELIYSPYLDELKKIILKIQKIDSRFNYGFSKKPGILTAVKKAIKKLI
jgi:hypothetical protein